VLVKGRVNSVLKQFLWGSLVAFLLIIAASLLIEELPIVASTFAFLLSFVFVGSNFFVIRKIKDTEESKFYWQFFITLSARFILVLVALVLILKTIKIHQIYFTVSFIISYIFHSVIEIISINKILETDNWN